MTDPFPVEAIKRLLRRSAYVLIPVSVLFVKYFPEYGRGYSPWTWEVYHTGVTTNKNGLGYICMTFGLFFVWSLLDLLSKKWNSIDKKDLMIHILFMVMTAWLFSIAKSATSMVCFILGVAILIGLGVPLIRRNLRTLGFLISFGIVALVFAQIAFGLWHFVLTSLGRDPTLTGRTDLWEGLIRMATNPLVGTGYESFWVGRRAEKVWAQYWWHPNQAHNGYLETYLNLGYIGIFLLVGAILSSYRKISRKLPSDFEYGRFRMALLFVTLGYNVTEAAFKGLHPVWFMFLLIALDYTTPTQARSPAKTATIENRFDRCVVKAVSAGGAASDVDIRKRVL